MSENNAAKELNHVLQNKGEEIPELRTIITISVNRENQLVVAAPLERPELCLQALADAIKVVADAIAENKKVIL